MLPLGGLFLGTELIPLFPQSSDAKKRGGNVGTTSVNQILDPSLAQDNLGL